MDQGKAANGMESPLQFLHGILLMSNVTENPGCPRHLYFLPSSARGRVWFQIPSSECKKTSSGDTSPTQAPNGSLRGGTLGFSVGHGVLERGYGGKNAGRAIANAFGAEPCIVWLEA